MSASAQNVRDIQDGVRTTGQPVTFVHADGTTRNVYARVRYLTAVELANAIEAYPLEVTFDARDFASQRPLKGDSVVIDNGRRGVMQVRESHISGALVLYRCGVQG